MLNYSVAELRVFIPSIQVIDVEHFFMRLTLLDYICPFPSEQYFLTYRIRTIQAFDF